MSDGYYELPELESILIDGYTINPQGALSGQALLFDAPSKSFIPGPSSGNLSGSFLAGQVAFAVGSFSLQGNSNFFWDDTDGYLGIGTGAPLYPLHIVGDGYFTSRTIIKGSTAAVSPSGSGALRFNSGTSHLEFSENGGSWTALGSSVSIGNPIGSGTSKSVLFVDGSGNLAQDNSNFAWDNSTHRLGIGNNGPAYPLDVTGVGRFTSHLIFDGYTLDLSAGATTNQVLAFNGSAFVATNQSGGVTGTLTSPKVPYATGSSTIADSGMSWDNTNKILAITTITGNDGLQVTDATRTIALGVTSSVGQLGTTSNHNLTFFTNNSSAQVVLSTGGQLGIGSNPSYALHVVGDGYVTAREIIAASSAAVSPTGTGAFRFNTGTSHLEFSESGGAWTQLGSGGGSAFGTSGQTLVNIIPLGAVASNSTSTPAIISGIAFNPSTYTLTTGGGFVFSAQSYVFRIVAACGNTSITGHVKLRDITAGVDITNFSVSGSTTESKQEQTLTVSSAGTNTIANAEHIYELQIYVTSPSIPTDFIQLYSAELRVISTI